MGTNAPPIRHHTMMTMVDRASACRSVPTRLEIKIRAPEAAKALRMGASDLHEFGIIDEIVKEPLSGAHKDFKAAASILRRALRRNLDDLVKMTPDELVRQRREKFRQMGSFI